MSGHRFLYLLTTLFLMLLVVPFLSAMGDFARIAFSLLFFNVILGAVYSVSDRRRHVLLVGSLAAAVILLRAISLAMAQDHAWWLRIRLTGLAFETLCLLCVVILVLKHVLTSRRVTFEVICASLCAYLLIGILWAQAYIFLAALDSQASTFDLSVISGQPAALDETSRLGPVDDIYVTAVYFSFVTLTTLGYGDITPDSQAAKMLCIVEAIVGQLYLTVLVARLVGLHIAGAAEDQKGSA